MSNTEKSVEEKNRVVIDTSPRGRLTSLLGAMNLDTAKPMVDEAIEEAIQAERKKREEAVDAERERIKKQYGNMNDGCGCCMDETLEDVLNREALTQPNNPN